MAWQGQLVWAWNDNGGHCFAVRPPPLLTGWQGQACRWPSRRTAPLCNFRPVRAGEDCRGFALTSQVLVAAVSSSSSWGKIPGMQGNCCWMKYTSWRDERRCRMHFIKVRCRLRVEVRESELAFFKVLEDLFIKTSAEPSAGGSTITRTLIRSGPAPRRSNRSAAPGSAGIYCFYK